MLDMDKEYEHYLRISFLEENIYIETMECSEVLR
jgi:hypothetical protein